MDERTPAATQILARPSQTPSGFEVLCVHRAPQLRFLGDFWCFPGGRIEAADPSPAAAAIRETYEEVGILWVEGAEGIDAAVGARVRAGLLDDSVSWPEAMQTLGLSGALRPIAHCGRWITPRFVPKRFDTAFFVSVVPRGIEPDVIEGELDQAAWLDPAALVQRWREDDALLAPPTRVTLQALSRCVGDPQEDGWVERAVREVGQSHPSDGEWPWAMDFRPGVRVFPIRTPTLPPATHTNCYLIGDGSEVVVIDPASPYPEERARLDALIDRCVEEGQRVREILLTHHHHDHVSGAAHLAERLGVPIAAHRRTQEILAGLVPVTRTIDDGEVWEFPADRPGARARRLRATLLEGHADGHLVFQEEVTGGVIAGDMVAGVGTILIAPPEGDMALYLESLRRLKGLNPSVLYPAHGPPIGDPAALIDFYIAHRLQREAKVLAAVAAGAGAIEDLVPRAYDDADPRVYPLAAKSMATHLAKLRAEGQVTEHEGRWATV